MRQIALILVILVVSLILLRRFGSDDVRAALDRVIQAEAER
jgi:hypothetical protein